MRIGLLADLHANREAVEACLEALARAGCERLVFLGDYVGYGADPAWVLDTLRARVAEGAVAVLGNHDAAVDDPSASGMHAQARAAIDWTRGQLDDEQRRFLRALPLQAEDDDRVYVHANPSNPAGWGYVASLLAARRALADAPQRLSFVGHVHEPALYYDRPGEGAAAHFQPQPGVAIPLLSSRRWLAVVGACGQPRDGNPAASCAWLETGTGRLTYLRVPYDCERAAAKIRAAGLPDAFALRLLEGT